MHAGFEHAPDAVPREQERKAGNVILVRVREDHCIDPSIPRRDAPIELDQQSIRIRPTVDEQATTVRPFDQDRVALADVEHAYASDAGWSGDHDGPGDGHADDECADGKSGRHRPRLGTRHDRRRLGLRRRGDRRRLRP